MAFPDQAGLIVPLKEVTLGQKFVCYHELVAIMYGRYGAEILNIYTRVEIPDRSKDSVKGILAGMLDGKPCPFDENTEVVRCST